MGKTMKYQITFHTDWHCGSGLAAGADADTLVVKDRDGLPFVPGKTIKGLLREAVDVMYGRTAAGYSRLFGFAEDYDNEKNGAEGDKADAFFSNAELSRDERRFILRNEAAEFMYRTLSATAINEDGIALQGSLRKLQVTIPCTVYGEIREIPDDMMEQVKSAMGYIKRLGLWRNRGLGRCTMEVPNL